VEENPMKDEILIKILRCPQCLSDLYLLEKNLVCNNCGQKYPIIDGIPILDASKSNQRDKYDKIYEDIYTKNNLEKSTVLANTEYLKDIQKLDIKDKIIIDMGSGLGLIAEKLLSAKKVIVVDLSFSSLVNLNRRKTENMVLICGDIAKTKVKIKSDIIICIAVLEHVQDPEIVLDNFRSVLKDGGILYLQVPVCNLPFQKFFIYLFRKLKRIDTTTAEEIHLRTYSTKSIINELTNNGFSIEDIKHTSVLKEFTYSSNLFNNKLFAAGIQIICKKTARHKIGADKSV
jgi:2-polyprenyl-3-methyl-5-hydroxy-6-metoxy-1,4-benzoquinol methylase